MAMLTDTLFHRSIDPTRAHAQTLWTANYKLKSEMPMPCLLNRVVLPDKFVEKVERSPIENAINAMKNKNEELKVRRSALLFLVWFVFCFRVFVCLPCAHFHPLVAPCSGGHSWPHPPYHLSTYLTRPLCHPTTILHPPSFPSS
jgi:hypothetical protein